MTTLVKRSKLWNEKDGGCVIALERFRDSFYLEQFESLLLHFLAGERCQWTCQRILRVCHGRMSPNCRSRMAVLFHKFLDELFKLRSSFWIAPANHSQMVQPGFHVALGRENEVSGIGLDVVGEDANGGSLGH